MRTARAFALVGLAALSVRAAGPDAERAAWRYRRSVSATQDGEGRSFTALAIPPEVAARSQPGLSDLRLVGADDVEVPFAIDAGGARVGTFERIAGRLVDTRSERKRQTSWVVDLGDTHGFDEIELDVPERDFAKRLKVEASGDGTTWSLLRNDAGIFDRAWTLRIHHTTIELDHPHEARYLRLTADDSASPPIAVRGVVVAARRSREGQAWSRPAPLRRVESKDGRSRYALDLPVGLPFETLHLGSDDLGFSRRVRLLERSERNGALQEDVLGEAVLYRLKLDDAVLAGESADLAVRPVEPRGSGALLLEIEDGDSPPLRNPRAIVSGAMRRLLFTTAGSSGALTLYNGNDVTRPPVYDLESLKGRIALEAALGSAALGAEEDNPLYMRPPPLPAVGTQGAALQVGAWRRVRTLPALAREDIYTLTLAPADLAALRPDLGDIRIVDAEDRQVPYVVASDAAEARVPLRKASTTRGARSQEGAWSTHRLTLVDQESGEPMALSVSALEIEVAEPFFNRPARLSAPEGPRGGPRLLYSGTLQRRSGHAPIVLGLGGVVTSELLLEIDEGDNAPLGVTAARALVSVPRIAFKGRSGAHRLLLGNSEAAPPRYDIAGLRREVLSYSATPVELGPGRDNPAFRRSAADYFKQAPPAVLLWGSLIGAVVGLVLVTLRVLKQAAAPE
jgi:hypothetical protein